MLRFRDRVGGRGRGRGWVIVRGRGIVWGTVRFRGRLRG